MSSPPRVNVLSYNVSFEASSHWNRAKEDQKRAARGKPPLQRHEYPSAWELGEACTEVPGKGGLTVCAQCQAAFIDSVLPSGEVFDFVGTQEAARSRRLQAASTVLSTMTQVWSRTSWSDMATYYDPAKYTPRPRAAGGVMQVLDHEVKTGRPLHLLVFDRVGAAGVVIVINVHNAHGVSYGFLTKRLQEAFDSMGLSPAEVQGLQGARIIATGDFNTAAHAPWTPLAGRVDTPIAVKDVPASGREPASPPNTCCSDPNGDYAAHKVFRPGDFVFDSLSPAVLEVPGNYPYGKKLSDHLPVVASLDPMV